MAFRGEPVITLGDSGKLNMYLGLRKVMHPQESDFAFSPYIGVKMAPNGYGFAVRLANAKNEARKFTGDLSVVHTKDHGHTWSESRGARVDNIALSKMTYSEHFDSDEKMAFLWENGKGFFSVSWRSENGWLEHSSFLTEDFGETWIAGNRPGTSGVGPSYQKENGFAIGYASNYTTDYGRTWRAFNVPAGILGGVVGRGYTVPYVAQNGHTAAIMEHPTAPGKVLSVSRSAQMNFIQESLFGYGPLDFAHLTCMFMTEDIVFATYSLTSAPGEYKRALSWDSGLTFVHTPDTFPQASQAASLYVMPDAPGGVKTYCLIKKTYIKFNDSVPTGAPCASFSLSEFYRSFYPETHGGTGCIYLPFPKPLITTADKTRNLDNIGPNFFRSYLLFLPNGEILSDVSASVNVAGNGLYHRYLYHVIDSPDNNVRIYPITKKAAYAYVIDFDNSGDGSIIAACENGLFRVEMSAVKE